jgi:hypothetical protein
VKALSPEALACIPAPIVPAGFNRGAIMPYGLTTKHIAAAMNDFLQFLRLVNTSLHAEKIPRLESIMMSANFSSLVGEFMNAGIPKYCKTLVKNKHFNGHPDMIPKGMFPSDRAQHATEGIEIKASRYEKGWQGHNPEDTWLMVFIYDSNRTVDYEAHPKPFQFLGVVGERLIKTDWLFSGRSDTSRRTITATVTPSGYAKMSANWIYRTPKLNQTPKNPARSKKII